MRKKGFTLVELLVVIAIIALLMSILMPALSKVRQLANRVVCGTNLKGIGSAMMLYSGDMDGDYPRAGRSGNTWQSGTNGLPNNETAQSVEQAYDEGEGNGPTITASYYLLVKYDYTSADQFLCKSDTGVSEFDAPNKELYWDFYATQGSNLNYSNPAEHCSYSLQLPYDNPDDNRSYYPNPATNPGMAIAADRNPYIESQAEEAHEVVTSSGQEKGFYWDPVDQTATREDRQNGNTPVHQKEGQNVLFNDGHVEFENWPYCGIEDDNIYTYWSNETNPTESDKQLGDFQTGGNLSSNAPVDREDTLLVNEDYQQF